MRRENFEGSRWFVEDEVNGDVSEKTLRRMHRKFPKVVLSDRTSRSEEKIRVSLSQIDRLLDCPFAYWCDRTARFESPPDTVEILDKLCLGNVMHEVWRRVTDAVVERETTHSSTLRSEWDSIIHLLSSEYPLLADARAGFTLSGLKRKMSAVADIIDEMWARAGKSGMRRLWTRTEYELPAIEIEDVVFVGRADRVDFWTWSGGEGVVLMDYKLGKNRNYGRSAQLASYGAALRNAGTQVIGFCYLCHGDAKKIGSWSPEMKEVFGRGTRGITCGEQFDAALERMAEAGRIIAGGRFEAKYDSPSCRFCGYTTICRRGERWGDYDARGNEDDVNAGE
jgi:RecB family exonuclease